MTNETTPTLESSHSSDTPRIFSPVSGSLATADCITSLKAYPDDYFDLTLADPPYNLSKGGHWKWDNSVPLPGFGGNWNKVMLQWDNMDLHAYLDFTLQWLSEVQRVTRPTGSVWIHGTYHNIGIINFGLQLLDVEIINELIWLKKNSFPNLSGRRLTASHETILWAHTGQGKRRYQFNYEHSKQMDCPSDSLKKPGKQMRTVWDISNNKSRDELAFGKHPTQKPVRLLRRMIQIAAERDQRCLIPFCGAGSECIAAIREGLAFHAFDTDPDYTAIAAQRIDSEIHEQSHTT